jgi:lysozyme family protein
VYYPAVLKLFAQKHKNILAAAVLKTRNEVLQEVSHEFADFTNKNERRVKDVSAAWATWKAIVTQARRATNEPGSEEEEMRQAELVARFFAGEAAKHVATKTWGKSSWRALSSEDSPLFVRSAHIQRTSF